MARSRGVIVPPCPVRGLRSDTRIAEVRSYHCTRLLCVLMPQAPARTRLHRGHRLEDTATHLPHHLYVLCELCVPFAHHLQPQDDRLEQARKVQEVCHVLFLVLSRFILLTMTISATCLAGKCRIRASARLSPTSFASYSDVCPDAQSELSSSRPSISPCTKLLLFEPRRGCATIVSTPTIIPSVCALDIPALPGALSASPSAWGASPRTPGRIRLQPACRRARVASASPASGRRLHTHRPAWTGQLRVAPAYLVNAVSAAAPADLWSSTPTAAGSVWSSASPAAAAGCFRRDFAACDAGESFSRYALDNFDKAAIQPIRPKGAGSTWDQHDTPYH